MDNYFKFLEEKSNTVKMSDMYLWPNTLPGTSDQNIIKKRVGASDLEHDNPLSRTFKVIYIINYLLELGYIKDNSTIVDITCGDAILIKNIYKTFNNFNIVGIDCAKNEFNYSSEIIDSGIKIYKGYIQHLFATPPPVKIDIALMLNSYRGWHSAKLSDKDKNLPILADEYFINNVRFTVVSATKNQIKNLRRQCNVMIIDKAEDDSILIIFSKELIKNSFIKKIKNYIKFQLFL